jgi:hypothetical protein
MKILVFIINNIKFYGEFMNLAEAKRLLKHNGYIVEEYDMITMKTSVPVQKRLDTFLDIVDTLGANSIPKKAIDTVVETIRDMIRSGAKKAEVARFGMGTNKEDLKRLLMMLNKAGIGAELKYGSKFLPYKIIITFDEDYEADKTLKDASISEKIKTLRYRLQDINGEDCSEVIPNTIETAYMEGRERAKVYISINKKDTVDKILQCLKELNFTTHLIKVEQVRFRRYTHYEATFLVGWKIEME